MSNKEFPKMLYKSAPMKEVPDNTTVHDEEAEAAARAVGYVDFADLPDEETGIAANDPNVSVERGEVVEQKPAKGKKPATYVAPAPVSPTGPTV